MIIIICCPSPRRSAFALFVDQMLSQELDWNLVRFRNQDPFSPLTLSPDQLIVSTTVGLSDSEVFSAIFQRPFDTNFIDQAIEFHMDTWVFDLSPSCTLLQLQHVIDFCHDLGCFIGLSAYPLAKGS